MRMPDPRPTFAYLVSEIAKREPTFGYIHLVEPRATGNLDREVKEGEVRGAWTTSQLPLADILEEQ
jgi:NADPH2 dehydrogenase